MQVTLTWYELAMASSVGARRQVEALKASRPDRHGYDGSEGWTVHIEGAAGELAVAKALGWYWNGSVNTYRDGGDVASLQVRTRSKDYYELLIRPNDDDDAIFVLVTGMAPTFTVRGWMYGREAKQPRYRQQHGGRPAAYFVPHAALHPMQDLASVLESVRLDEELVSKTSST